MDARGAEAAAHDLARQLGLLLSAYRLFPEDPEQPAFVAAVERVRRAAEQAVAVDAADLEVRSGRLLLRGEPLPVDEHTERLAAACFERRVELVRVRRLPDAGDLRRVAEVLSRPVEDVTDDGGAQRWLQRAGVGAVALGAVEPEVAEAAGGELVALEPELQALWEQVEDPGRFAANLMVGGLTGQAADVAGTLYRRFRTLHSVLPESVAGRRGLLRNLHRTLELLPQGVRTEFVAVVLGRLEREAFAGAYATSLTDRELVDVLLEMAADGGPDPRELAEAVVGATRRPPSVLELLEQTIAPAAAEVGEGVREHVITSTSGRDRSEVEHVIADTLGHAYLGAVAADAAAARELYPRTPEEHRPAALFALADYLRADPDPEQMDLVLTAWAEAVRSALLAGDPDLVDRLLETVEGTTSALHGERLEMAVAAPSRVPDRLLLDALLETSPGAAGEADPVGGLLARFGSVSVEPVLDALAEEEDRGRRARLLALAVELAGDDVQRLASRLDDPRWYLVRNVVGVIGRVGDASAVGVLRQVTAHPDAHVRREAARSLVAAAGVVAVPLLRDLALTDPDGDVRATARHALGGLRSDEAASALARIARSEASLEERRHALELLGSHGSDTSRGLLDELASRGGTRLPRSLRKAAANLRRARR